MALSVASPKKSLPSHLCASKEKFMNHQTTWIGISGSTTGEASIAWYRCKLCIEHPTEAMLFSIGTSACFIIRPRELRTLFSFQMDLLRTLIVASVENHAQLPAEFARYPTFHWSPAHKIWKIAQIQIDLTSLEASPALPTAST